MFLTVDVLVSWCFWQLMFSTVDVLEVDYFVVDVLEVDVLGVRRNIDLNEINKV